MSLEWGTMFARNGDKTQRVIKPTWTLYVYGNMIELHDL